MDTLISDQSSPMAYTNRFCVAMLAVFATYNPSEAALTVLSSYYRKATLFFQREFYYASQAVVT